MIAFIFIVLFHYPAFAVAGRPTNREFVTAATGRRRTRCRVLVSAGSADAQSIPLSDPRGRDRSSSDSGRR